MSIRVNILKAIGYYQRVGLRKMIRRIKNSVIKPGTISYSQWLKQFEQRNEKVFKRQGEMVIAPSFVVYIYGDIDNHDKMTRTISSLEKQKYDKWTFVKPAAIQDKSDADYLLLMKAGDMLSSYALWICAKEISGCLSGADAFYFDEDTRRNDGEYINPWFKPDFNYDLLCSFNYIGAHLIVKYDKIDLVSLSDFCSQGALVYALIFSLVEKKASIAHISGPYYHSDENFLERTEALQPACKTILQAYYDRSDIPAAVRNGRQPGIFHSKYSLPGHPLVSIIIPNKDHREDLEKCLNSLQKLSYPNYEIIIVENNSISAEIFHYYESLKESGNISVVNWDKPFNYSAINNYGVNKANGEYLLFLNNDTEVISVNLIEEMLAYCMREDVGAVGAKLYYPDDTIQHAGVIIGYGGIAGHTFIGCQRADGGYFNRADCVQDYSAVTAACMMADKKVFKQAGGFSEQLKVAYNDSDFCLKVIEQGYLVVYNPYAELYHYESRSRGIEDTPAKVKRFNSEVNYFRKRWHEVFTEGDPCYNKFLTLDKSDFTIRL